ncbi:ABC transporter substrate-binding protein [Microbacterium ulmi]|uniref:Extracellular solute-binding protein n=1 Tax=Microbacterium ulmi TaxID=179095 RepID=A0A7Y2LZT1_9MICO|nr:extracellular solute-binding protein [Microbacterium ulmi]NII69919.1 ABC-type glycerol-3-phosphate transport system substrate-binding protein [Microbacterium ulmi]NNH03839.1 extracellular solute-binding protein [Microbacterium ulmi]
MTKQRLRVALATGSILAMTALSACSSGTAPQASAEFDPEADVTITVGDMPKADKPEELARFKERIEEFEAANPHITVEGSTETWDAQTFQAKLTGGTLPTVMGVSLTYGHELIARKQVPDMTPYLEELDMLDDLNPLALANVQDAAGLTYAVPTGLFSVGLAYNRAIFEQAGLDPDAPPTTWDQVREYAKTISEKVPGVAGYAQLTTNNTGGWMLTTMTYSMGGRIQSADGTKSEVGEATQEALQLLHDMRWEDDSMGSQFLYDQDQARKEFAAGKIGMIMQAPDAYHHAIFNYGMDPADYGEGELPQANGVNGTLTGGTLKLFNTKATPNQLFAALKWIKYYDFDQYYNQELAVANAKATAASKSPVGMPGLPPVAPEIDQRYLGWIADSINVPRDQFSGYVDSTLDLIPEPVNATQQIYAALDPVVQKILTDENADVAAAVKDASATVDMLTAQASR